MAQTKTKEELVRLSWLTELRRQGHRRCEGEYFVGTNVCALGLLAEVAGLSVYDVDEIGDADIGGLAGLSAAQSAEIWRRNDGASMDEVVRPTGTSYCKHTFAEIADVVAGWFKP